MKTTATTPRLLLTASAVAILAAVLILSNGKTANADTYRVDFGYDLAGVSQASGFFTYDSSLDGGIIRSSDLDSYSIDVLGENYGLDFLQDNNSYRYFEFDSASNTFLMQDVAEFAADMGAIKIDFSKGFAIGEGTYRNDVFLIDGSAASTYDTKTISKSVSNVAVPEANSAALLGIALPLLGTVAIAVRKRSK